MPGSDRLDIDTFDIGCVRPGIKQLDRRQSRTRAAADVECRSCRGCYSDTFDIEKLTGQ